MAANDDLIKSLPGAATVTGVQYAGYVSVTPTPNGDDPAPNAAQLFYWLAGPSSENLTSTPVVLWTNGGPGSPSFWGVFTENGPYSISDANQDLNWPTLTPREKAWNNYVNYLVIEQPLGCTLSFKDGNKVPDNPQDGAVQYYGALLNVLRRHGLTQTPLAITGESYAGTYLPLLAEQIVQGGELKNFKGMVLADSWVDPQTQLQSDTLYSVKSEYKPGSTLITSKQQADLDRSFTVYTNPFNGSPEINGVVTDAATKWAKDYLAGQTTATGLSIYGFGTAIPALCAFNSGIGSPYITNIGKLCGSDPDLQRVIKYLNQAAVRKALHVPDGKPPIPMGWGGSDDAWNTWNQSESVVPQVQDLLDNHGLEVLVLSGVNDAKDCNWMGTQKWLDLSLKPSPEVVKFRNSASVDWHTGQHGEGPTGGTEKGSGRLRWLKILNAGHMAAMDQPDLIFYITSRMFPTGQG